MTNSDADKKPASGKTPVSQKPRAELNDNDLKQISGGGPPIAVAGRTSHGKKPFKMT